MGLDWCLKDRIKPGNEEEAEILRGKLDEMDEETKEYKLARSRLDEISVSPAETLGAPRIGIDKAATDWLRKQHKEVKAEIKAAKKAGNRMGDHYVQHWSRPFKEILKEEHGKYVIDLVGYNASTVTGMIAAATDFRGKCIGRCDILPDGLQNEAYQDHGPAEMLAYAKRLEDAVAKILKMSAEDVKARAKTLGEELEAATKDKAGMGYYEVSEKWYDGLSKKDKQIYELSTVLEGANWLRFWGERGHGYWAWY